MEIAERKEELLKYSAREVRNNRTLFAEFVFIYEHEGGRENCKSCAFQRIYTQWRNKGGINTKIIKKMSNNTFKLKNEKEQIAVPFSGDVITSQSPDEMVTNFLNQDKGIHRQARIDRFFAEVPKKKAAKKVAEIQVNEPKVVSKKKTSKSK